MTPTNRDIDVRGDARDVYERFRAARRRTLVGPEDDMWATFADLAEPCALIVDQRVVGCCSIDDDNQLHAFHVNPDLGQTAADVFDRVLGTNDITAAMPSTVDPAFLSLSLSAGSHAEPVALMYELSAEPAASESVDLRRATRADHAAAVSFDHAQTGSPEALLGDFLAARIDQGELYLVEDSSGRITATGECRVDSRAPGHAHLGLVVGTGLRKRGLGTRLMRTLTEAAIARGLTPLCSTEPSNLAAQRVIHRAGFRSRHRVFRVPTTPPRSR